MNWMPQGDPWADWQRRMEDSWLRFPRGVEPPTAHQMDQVLLDFSEEAVRQGLAVQRQLTRTMVESMSSMGMSGQAGHVVQDMMESWLSAQEGFWANWFTARRHLDWTRPSEASERMGEIFRESLRRGAQSGAESLAGGAEQASGQPEEGTGQASQPSEEPSTSEESSNSQASEESSSRRRQRRSNNS
jgi:hypothetical protein